MIPAPIHPLDTKGRPIILVGLMGSGKTTVLVNRVANIIRFGKVYGTDWLPREVTAEELATLRKVLRSFVQQIDSLNRENQQLSRENDNLKTQNRQAKAHISNLSSENEALSEKVDIASQLDATGIWAEGRNKRGKKAKRIKDVKKFAIGFNIARNVTTATGVRSIYIRIATPTGEVLTQGGTFEYENRQLEFSIRKDIEYTGEEQSIQVWWDVTQTLSAGAYRVDIFADGRNIGSTTFTFEK